MKRVCVTGGAGFIGSNLVDELIARGVEVVVVDDFRTGKRENLEAVEGNPNFSLVEGDVLNIDTLKLAFHGCDWIFHLQANADVRFGLEHPTKDLEQNTITTSVVLEAMRLLGIRNICFASTGSVYGEPSVFPTPEDCPFPEQTSLYGASKVAAEALIAAYCWGWQFTGVVARFVSILGERYSHGHVIDFVRALQRDPTRLEVLGDGTQQKAYLYVQDCIDALLLACESHENTPGVAVYNLGTDQTITVNESIAVISSHLGVRPRLEYSGGSRGWIGDSPFIHLDTSKIRKLGWAPSLSIEQAILRTIDWLSTSGSVGAPVVAES